ncbi:hypothetical protein QJS66_10745 [Kocuria rhizophila]|nr:hypothetical protein QJS66_10745 [Kocuria rhizophila]
MVRGAPVRCGEPGRAAREGPGSWRRCGPWPTRARRRLSPPRRPQEPRDRRDPMTERTYWATRGAPAADGRRHGSCAMFPQAYAVIPRAHAAGHRDLLPARSCRTPGCWCSRGP